MRSFCGRSSKELPDIDSYGDVCAIRNARIVGSQSVRCLRVSWPTSRPLKTIKFSLTGMVMLPSVYDIRQLDCNMEQSSYA